MSTTDTRSLTPVKVLGRVVMKLALLKLPIGNVWGNF